MPRFLSMVAGATTLFPVSALMLGLAMSHPAQADGARCLDDICAQWAEPTGNVCRVAGMGNMTGAIEDGAAFLLSRDILDQENTFDRERPDGCFTGQQPYALQGFVLSMDNHSVDRMRVLFSPGQYDVGIRDGDGGDVASGIIWATPLPRDTEFRIVEFRNCRFSCEFDLSRFSDGPLPDGLPVIVGFDLDRDGDDGGHLREMAIELGAPGRLTVRYGEPDWRFSGTVQIGWVDVSILQDANMRVQFDYGGHDGEERPPRGEVHPDLLQPAQFPQLDHALYRFSMAFQNGGHFLGHIGIERDGDQYEAWAQDRQPDDDFRYPDDPFRMSAEYGAIRPFLEAIDGPIEFGPVMIVE